MPDLEAVLSEFAPALARLSALYAHTAADRDDLFQEIAIALWRALPTFRGDSSLRTFVFRIAHNRGLSFRARGRRPAHDADVLEQIPTSEPNAEERLEREQQGERLLQALTLLPPLQREAISLQLEGLSTDEICGVLGISANALGVRLHRARHSLRSLLSDVRMA